MTLGDELGKLGELHQRGVLSDEEFARAKQRVLGDTETHRREPAAINTFHRSRGDRWLGGVCGGLGQVSGLAAWMWRLIFTLLVLCAGTGVLVYLLLWVFVPDDAVRFDRRPGEVHPG